MSESIDEYQEPQPAKQEVPEYERPLLLVCAIAGLGPFALPLIWRHPRMGWHWKILITLGVAALTWGCILLTKVMIGILIEQWQLILDASS